jgi:type IV secretory pathway TrbD component
MLDLTNYIQILHNLLCASVCHFQWLLAHLQLETLFHADKGTMRVCGRHLNYKARSNYKKQKWK